MYPQIKDILNPYISTEVCCFDSDYCFDTVPCFLMIPRLYCELVCVCSYVPYWCLFIFVYETYSMYHTCLYNVSPLWMWLTFCHSRHIFLVGFVCLLYILVSNRAEGKVLETVGVFEAPKQNGKYETGQVRVYTSFGSSSITRNTQAANLFESSNV